MQYNPVHTKLNIKHVAELMQITKFMFAPQMQLYMFTHGMD